MVRPTLIAAALVASLLPAAPVAQAPADGPAQTLKIVALGDMPYGEPAEVYAPFEALINEINDVGPDLVLHIGDTKGGGTPCSDQALRDQLFYMNSFQAPTLYTPGDNEWTDCYREAAGGFDPRGRLAFIRQTYFADPATSFGVRTLAVAHQGEAGFPENARLQIGGVGVVTAHVVGSNNGFEIHDPEAAAEFFVRNAATTDWLTESFAALAGAEIIVVAIHANMFEFDFNEFGAERWLRHSGFAAFGPALQRAAADFGKPVLLIYGDSHIFRVTRPFPKLAPNVTALEVFGAADMHAVEIDIETGAGAPRFRIAPLMNPGGE